MSLSTDPAQCHKPGGESQGKHIVAKKEKADTKKVGSEGAMKRKDYERELERLHVELVTLQEWVKSNGAKISVSASV